MASRQSLTDLPDLIVEQIFSCIDVFGRESDRLSFSQVCKKFRDIERGRTVLELLSLNSSGANPVKALALYPNLTALKADRTTCKKWFDGRFGEVHTSQHSFRVLHLDCSAVCTLHPLFHDLMPGVPIRVPDSWRPKGALTGPRGTLEELVVGGWDGLDLRCVRDESYLPGGVAAGRLRKLSLVGASKNGYQLIFDVLGPALVSLDLSGLKRGNFYNDQTRVGEFVEDGMLTQVASQCPNLKELFLGPGRAGNSFLKGLEAIVEKCVQLETLGQDNQRGGEACVWPKCEWATDEALAVLSSKAKSLTQLSWGGSTKLTAQGLLALRSGLAAQLKVLTISCRNITTESVDACLGAATGLEDLCLDPSYGIITCTFLRQMRALTSLVLLSCSDTAIEEVASNCPELKELHFPREISIMDRCAVKLFTGCPSITNLSITGTGNHQLRLSSLAHLEKLESLVVTDNLREADFTDDLLLQLVHKNAKLAKLEIRKAGASLTDMGVFRAISASKSLTTLMMLECRALTKSVVSFLANSGTLNLLIVSLNPQVGSPFLSTDAGEFEENSRRLKLLTWGGRNVDCKYVPWLS